MQPPRQPIDSFLDESRTVIVSARITHEVETELEALAKRIGITKSFLVLRLLGEGLTTQRKQGLPGPVTELVDATEWAQRQAEVGLWDTATRNAVIVRLVRVAAMIAEVA